MRFEVLFYLILRLLVGLFMITHALFSIVMYSAYTFRVQAYLKDASMLDNSFCSLAAPLFPFVEFFLGACIILGLYYKITLKMSLIVLIGASLLIIIAQPISLKALVAISLVCCAYILLTKADKYRCPRIFNKQLFREKSLQQ